ncbi:MAG: hypothetical protein MJ160_05245 [Treponema sp.]|nr:hypothetical protein [Treponema sp.]
MTITFWIGLAIIIFLGIDIIGFFCGGLSDLPTSFTEYWCYPLYYSFLYPMVKDGFGMFTASIIRIFEFLGIIAGVVLIMLH